jgi:hypothetical protein
MSQTFIENLVPALFAIITTIVGGIFGYVLSEVAEARREARTTQRQATALRRLLHLEAGRNLEALREGWANVGHDPERELDDRGKRDAAGRYLEAIPGRFSRRSFDSQLGLLALLLPVDEINRVYTFYDRLDVLAYHHAGLLAAKADQHEEQARFTQSASQFKPGNIVYSPRQPFERYAAAHWDEIAGIVTGLLDSGNPVGKDAA